MANGDKMSVGFKWFVGVFGTLIAGALIAIGATHEKVKTNTANIIREEKAREKTEVTIGKTLDKLVTQTEGITTAITEQKIDIGKIKTEMIYLRRMRRNSDRNNGE